MPVIEQARAVVTLFQACACAIALLGAGCAGEANEQDPEQQQQLTWTIDRANCACDGEAEMELATVRGSLTERDEAACVLFHGQATTDFSEQEILLREGDVLSLVAMLTCQTTTKPTWPPDECAKLDEICGGELGVRGQVELDPATIKQSLCERPGEAFLRACCTKAVEVCLNPETEECQAEIRACAEQLGVKLREPIELSGSFSELYQRVCFEGRSPLDPQTSCCQTADACSQSDREQSCRTCFGTASVTVDFSDDHDGISLSLSEDECGKRPAWLTKAELLSPCEQ